MINITYAAAQPESIKLTMSITMDLAACSFLRPRWSATISVLEAAIRNQGHDPRWPRTLHCDGRGCAMTTPPDPHAAVPVPAVELEALRRDRERIDWIDAEIMRHSVVEIRKTELFSVSSQWVRAIYGVRSLLDEAMK